MKNFGLLLMALAVLVGCKGVSHPTQVIKLPTETVTVSVTPRPTRTPTQTLTNTATPTPSSTNTATPTPTSTLTPSLTPTPTSTAIGGGTGKLFFTLSGEQGKIFSVNTDGTNLSELVADENIYWMFLSPEGHSIAFGGLEGVYQVNTDGSNAKQLLPAGYYLSGWFPDSKSIFGSKDSGEGFRLNLDNDQITLLVSTGDLNEVNTSFFSLSPDGTKLAFANRNNSRQRIYVMDLASTAILQVSKSSGPEGHWAPKWSPDSTKLFFTACSNGCNLGLVNADGTAQKTVGRNLSPAGAFWFNDTAIIFRREYSSGIGYAISKINLDGTDEIDLITDEKFGIAMALSPDRHKIAFLGDCIASYNMCDVFVADLDGSNRIRITYSPGNYSNLIWSP